MRSLEIPNLPDDVYTRIEQRARLRGKTVAEQAAEFLAQALAADDKGEAVLLDEIRQDRQRMAERGVFITDDDIREARRSGRE
jgi:plasmid stability protein